MFFLQAAVSVAHAHGPSGIVVLVPFHHALAVEGDGRVSFGTVRDGFEGRISGQDCQIVHTCVSGDGDGGDAGKSAEVKV